MGSVKKADPSRSLTQEAQLRLYSEDMPAGFVAWVKQQPPDRRGTILEVLRDTARSPYFPGDRAKQLLVSLTP